MGTYSLHTRCSQPRISSHPRLETQMVTPGPSCSSHTLIIRSETQPGAVPSLSPSGARSAYLFAVRHLVVGQQALHDVSGRLVAVLIHAGQVYHLQRRARPRLALLQIVLEVQSGGARGQALRGEGDKSGLISATD